jgi:hypothetical protein
MSNHRFLLRLLAGMLSGGFLAIVLFVFVMLPARDARRLSQPPATTTSPATEEAKNALLFFSPDEMRRLNRELITYQNFHENLKIFLPVLGVILVTVFGTLGFYLVRSNFFEAQMGMKDDVQKRLTEMSADLREWKKDAKADADSAKTSLKNDFGEFQVRSKELQDATRDDLARKAQEAATAATDAKEAARLAREESRALAFEQTNQIHLQNEQVNYALALSFWRMGDHERAISYARRALEGAQLVLGQLDETDSRRSMLAEHVWSVTADLAYYCAESHEVSGSREDTDEALRCARLLSAHLEAQTSTHRIEEGWIALIDNYLFVVSRVKPLTIQDRDAWKACFERWRRHVREHLRDSLPPERADELFRSYEAFANSLGQEG